MKLRREPPHVTKTQWLTYNKGQYPLPQKFPVVAGSDGAGDVVAVGSKVTRFKPGQKVNPPFTPLHISRHEANVNQVVTLFNQGHLGGSLNSTSIQTGLGGVIDGTIRTHGVFNEEGLVEMPQNLNYLESATLTCAGLTAWNALYGLKQLMPGDWVLTQGTGGVSLFAVQFAKAAGAKVIATTSSKEKEQILKKLGADVVINYKENPEWGVMAKMATTDGQGVAHVVEVGGPQTMAQSLEAVKIDGIITIIGFVAKGNEPQPSFLECLSKGCTARGLLVGSRDQFEAMVGESHRVNEVRQTNERYRTVLLLPITFTQFLTRRSSLWMTLERKLLFPVSYGRY